MTKSQKINKLLLSSVPNGVPRHKRDYVFQATVDQGNPTNLVPIIDGSVNINDQYYIVGPLTYRLVGSRLIDITPIEGVKALWQVSGPI